MTAESQTVIRCDGCGTRKTLAASSASEARKALAKDGWGSRTRQHEKGRLDMCPKCWRKYQAGLLRFVKTVRVGEMICNGGNKFKASREFTVPYPVAVHLDESEAKR